MRERRRKKELVNDRKRFSWGASESLWSLSALQRQWVLITATPASSWQWSHLARSFVFVFFVWRFSPGIEIWVSMFSLLWLSTQTWKKHHRGLCTIIQRNQIYCDVIKFVCFFLSPQMHKDSLIYMNNCSKKYANSQLSVFCLTTQLILAYVHYWRPTLKVSQCVKTQKCVRCLA